MKLSELILQGVGTYPQVRFDYFTFDDELRITGCCALGAAFIACKGEEAAKALEFLPSVAQGGAVMHAIMECTGLDLAELKAKTGEYEGYPMVSAITRSNDYQRMSLEQIAAWLEGQGL